MQLVNLKQIVSFGILLKYNYLKGIIKRNRKGGCRMILKYCTLCGGKLAKITTKSALYKAVCTDCEMTYKVMQEFPGKEVITASTSSPSQMTEAVMNQRSDRKKIFTISNKTVRVEEV